MANKYQIAFDQPKLCLIYVDKILKGANKVQTLSRLNRIYPGYNKKTFVIDFKNEYESIQKSFESYYTEAVLGEVITPSAIRNDCCSIVFLTIMTLNNLSIIYIKSENMVTAWGKLRYNKQNADLAKLEIQSTIKRFLRFYSFLIQVIRY